MSEYNFKKFTKTGAKLGNYTISISASCSFGFNSGFYNKEQIKNYKKVVLFFDGKRKAVAFQFTNDEKALGAFTVIHGNQGSTGSVTARSFFVENGLDKMNYSGKKTPKKISDEALGNLYVIHLEEKELSKSN